MFRQSLPWWWAHRRRSSAGYLRYLTPMEVLHITSPTLPVLPGGIIEMDELEEVVEGIFKFAGITVRQWTFIIWFSDTSFLMAHDFSPAGPEDAGPVCGGCQELPWQGWRWFHNKGEWKDRKIWAQIFTKLKSHLQDEFVENAVKSKFIYNMFIAE